MVVMIIFNEHLSFNKTTHRGVRREEKESTAVFVVVWFCAAKNKQKGKEIDFCWWFWFPSWIHSPLVIFLLFYFLVVTYTRKKTPYFFRWYGWGKKTIMNKEKRKEKGKEGEKEKEERNMMGKIRWNKQNIMIMIITRRKTCWCWAKV